MACECAHDHNDQSRTFRAKALTLTDSRAIVSSMARAKLQAGKGLSPEMADHLRAFLRDLGKNQSELARMTKMSPSAFSRFMSGGNGSVDMVRALSGAPGVNLWEHLAMDRMPATANFLTAAEQMRGAVTEEAIARVRLIVRLPAGMADAPVDWWTVRLLLEEQSVQHHAKLSTFQRNQESIQKTTRTGKK